jgi:hypothetical protein
MVAGKAMSDFAWQIAGAIVLAVMATVSDYLHHGLLYMANPEGHSPRWWSRHPEAKQASEIKATSKNKSSVPEATKPLSYRDFWGFAVVIVGIVSTFLGTLFLPWWFYYVAVTVVYFGFFLLVFDGIKRKWHPAVLSWLAIISGLTGTALWTFGVVLAKVDVVTDAKLGSDNTVMMIVDNMSTQTLRQIDLEISVDGMIVPKVYQLSPVCQGFAYFPEGGPAYVRTNQGNLLPAGQPFTPKGRIVCSEIPPRSVATIFIPVDKNNMGKNPNTIQNDGPSKWFAVNGVYIALGKTRNIRYQASFP